MSIRSRALRKIKPPKPVADATINANDLRTIVAAARPLIEDSLDTADQLAAFRETAAEKNLDWSQIKNLVKAVILDERDAEDGRVGERVKNLAAKADKISSYLELLKNDSGDKKSPDKCRANPHAEARAMEKPREGADARQVGLSDGTIAAADPIAECGSRASTGRTVDAGRGATTPAPIEPVVSQPRDGESAPLIPPRPSGALSSNSAIEAADLRGPHPTGRIEPDSNAGFGAASTLSDDDGSIPLFLRRDAEACA